MLVKRDNDYCDADHMKDNLVDAPFTATSPK